MTVGDILDGAFKLLKANAKTLFTIVAVFVVPLQLLGAFAQRNVLGGAGFFDALNDPSLAEAGTEQPVTDQLISYLATLLNLVVLPFLAGAISQVVGASYLGEELSPGPALARTLRRAWSLFASWVVVHVLEVGALVALPVMGIVLAVLVDGPLRAVFVLFALVTVVAGIAGALAVMALSVAVAPAVVVEELGPIRGIRRSWSLMRRRFWPVLGIALLAGLISNVLGQVLGVVPTFAGVIVGLEWGWILVAVGAILTALVTTPIVAIVATLQYFDARIRFEGFDLQVIAAELGPTRVSR
jgi:MFS family permease